MHGGPGVHRSDSDRRGVWGSGQPERNGRGSQKGPWEGTATEGSRGSCPLRQAPTFSSAPARPSRSALGPLEPRAAGLLLGPLGCGCGERPLRLSPDSREPPPQARRPLAAPGPRGRPQALLLQGGWTAPLLPVHVPPPSLPCDNRPLPPPSPGCAAPPAVSWSSVVLGTCILPAPTRVPGPCAASPGPRVPLPLGCRQHDRRGLGAGALQTRAPPHAPGGRCSLCRPPLWTRGPLRPHTLPNGTSWGLCPQAAGHAQVVPCPGA